MWVVIIVKVYSIHGVSGNGRLVKFVPFFQGVFHWKVSTFKYTPRCDK